MRVGARQLFIGLALTGLLTVVACKNVCQKFADHVEACRHSYCESHADNPICAQRHDADERCPAALHPVMEAQLDKDCDDLARQMGWEALSRGPER